MTDNPRVSPWLLAAGVAIVPVLAMPVGDPDLWWHLSSARWMIEHHSVPRFEWISCTMSGKPWVDFEWLSQLIFYGAYRGGGLAGLWLLKGALLSAAGVILCLLFRDLEIAPPYQAAGLALWASGVIPRDDIRTELFSVALFALLLRILHSERRRPGVLFLMFALWANLHAGFAYGLLLQALYASGEFIAAWSNAHPDRFQKGKALLVDLGASVAGTMLNPFGFSLYAVLWRHVQEIGQLRTFIIDWGSLGISRPGHWPTWVILAGTAYVACRAWLRYGRPHEHSLTAANVTLIILAALTLRHARAAPYFITWAVPVWLAIGFSSNILPKPDWKVLSVAAGILIGTAAFSIWCGRSARIFRQLSHEAYLPSLATTFLQRHMDLSKGRMHNPWGWGGYLGFHLYPEYRIFQDGRYLFHPLFLEASKTVGSPENWNEFLKRYGVSVVLLENIPLQVPMPRLYPDGSTRAFSRPYYIAYMPRERWALIYWDEKALIFIRRDSIADEQLAAMEYRLARPGDNEALGDALARREIDVRSLQIEISRHAHELADLAQGPR